jgi:hypothetical protein
MYYNNYSGNSSQVLWNIVKRHFKPFRNHDGRKDYGKGVYLFCKPDLNKTMNKGVVACRVLSGKKFYVNDPNADDIPEGYHTKFVDLGANTMLVVPNADQILPLGVIHCGHDVDLVPMRLPIAAGG